MKITVCFKTVADFSMLSEHDWTVNDHHRIDTGFARHIFNCFEESALEMALRLSEQARSLGNSSELTALTIDNQKADLFLTHLCAVQYDNVVRINCDKDIDLGFNPLSVSLAILTYMKKIKQQQLVFLGSHGGEGDNCQTGMLLAERAGWPCIRNVVGVEAVNSSSCLKVTSKINGRTLVQKVTLPLILIIGNAPDVPYLRVPTLNQKLKARNKQISVLSFSDLELDNKTIIHNDKLRTELWRHKSFRHCSFIEGNHAREKAQQLYNCYLKKRLMP
jgi:electron transfer flavoprotein beta subunit